MLAGSIDIKHQPWNGRYFFAKYYRPTTKLFKSSTLICEPERFLKKGSIHAENWMYGYNRIEMAEYFTKYYILNFIYFKTLVFSAAIPS